MSKERAAQLLEAGVWLKLSGDREGARKLFERALKLDPGNEKAQQLLSEGAAGEAPPSPPASSTSRVTPPPSVPSPLGAHPFEPPASSPSGGLAEAGWGGAQEPGLDSDWGRLTGAVTPVPQQLPATSPPRPDPGPYTSSSSNVVLGSPSPVPGAPAPAAPKTTLQLFKSGGEPPERAARTTLQLFTPSPGEGAEPPPRPHKPTLQLFNEPRSEVQAPRTISIGGDPGPELPPPSTPPLFGYSPQAPAPPSSPRGPAEAQAAAPAPEGPVELPPGAGSSPALEAHPDNQPPLPRTATDPFGHAWSWSASAPRTVDPDRPLEPRPSPSLAPRAESAWDQRSNPGIKLEAVVGRDKALDLISSDSKVAPSPEKTKGEIAAILNGARDLLDLDDHTGAMDLILKAQAIAPDDPDVKAMRERSEKTLLNMFESKLGKLDAVPRVLLKDDEIIWLNLDHRAGFVLAQIDGTVSFDDLFSVSGMTRLDTARILVQLVDEGVISRG